MVKKKKVKQWQSKTIKELIGLVQKAGQELVKLKMEKETAKTKDTTAVKKKRKEIAVLKTLIREKQLAEGVIRDT